MKTNLIKTKNIKLAVRKMNLHISKEALIALETKLTEFISTAGMRAKNNGRRTISTRDL